MAEQDVYTKTLISMGVVFLYKTTTSPSHFCQPKHPQQSQAHPFLNFCILQERIHKLLGPFKHHFRS